MDDIFWPVAKRDYDCDKGKAEIASNLLNFDNPLPYNSVQNDPLLTGSSQDNLCKLHDANDLHNCASQRCLVAHDEYNATTSDTITVCCAWDMPLEPIPDRDLHYNITITIPTLFLTMQQGAQLQETALQYSLSQAVIYSRWKPAYNPSSLLIWMLGVFVAALAAYGSASDYQGHIQKWLYKLRQRRRQQLQHEMGGTSSQQQQAPPPRTSSSLQDETLELEPIHALFFVIMASTSLLVLFFFKVCVRNCMFATLIQQTSCSNRVLLPHCFYVLWLCSLNIFLSVRFTTLSRSCTPLAAPMPSFKSLRILCCHASSDLPTFVACAAANASCTDRKTLGIYLIGTLPLPFWATHGV